MNDVPAMPIEYASTTGVARPRLAFYRVAIACAIVPQAVGVAILGLFAWTDWRSLAVIGFLWLGVGVLLFLIGGGFLVAFTAGLERCEPDVRQAWRRGVWVAGLLLISNFATAAACMWVGGRLYSYYHIRVTNRSGSTVSNIMIVAPASSHTVASLAPGESRKFSFILGADGPVTFSATQNGRGTSGTISEYATHPLGGRASLDFTPGGSVAAPAQED